MYTNGIATNRSHSKIGLEEHYRQAYNAQDYIRRYFNYLSYIMEHLDTAIIEQMIETFITAAHNGKTIYLLGNGGSAATASHMAADFLFGTWLPDHPPFRVISLNDNIPVMTAIANDTDYSCLFCSQLRSLVQPGDVVLALSVSGNSPNVLEAVQLARAKGAITLGCCGFDGGLLRELVDICLHIPSLRGEYGPVEDIMMILDHVMHSYIMLSRQGTLQRGQGEPTAKSLVS
jgi:D-sedoheptulose 7-phosphate isomerase